MTEITHHDALNDDGFHEIQLSGKQLVALFMAATVVLVFTFLCGVQIGRNVRSDRVSVTDATETLASSSVTPPPASASSTKRTWRHVFAPRVPVLS